MPSADDSLSTTRITLPKHVPVDLCKVDITHRQIEDAHWPLIFMTVLTQASVGLFSAIAWMQLTGERAHASAAFVSLAVALSALCASTFHLGRPIHAARALKMWRRSWLSREVLLFALFATTASVYSAALLFRFTEAAIFLGAATALIGIGGVAASARLYLAPGRPAWNTPITFLEFFTTALLLGIAGANVLGGGDSHREPALLAAAILSATTFALKLGRLRLASRYELFASWQLCSSVLLTKLLLRLGTLALGTCVLLMADSIATRMLGVGLLVAGEFVGRYLFFVSVVPSNIASGYLAQEAA
jgi:formate dehydrogenase iron-sulfur subunit